VAVTVATLSESGIPSRKAAKGFPMVEAVTELLKLNCPMRVEAKLPL
jgi:hypothetical protein